MHGEDIVNNVLQPKIAHITRYNSHDQVHVLIITSKIASSSIDLLQNTFLLGRGSLEI